MKKLISAVLAGAMALSMGVATFAARPAVQAEKAEFTVAVDTGATVSNTATYDVEIDLGSTKLNFKTGQPAGTAASDLASAIATAGATGRWAAGASAEKVRFLFDTAGKQDFTAPTVTITETGTTTTIAATIENFKPGVNAQAAVNDGDQNYFGNAGLYTEADIKASAPKGRTELLPDSTYYLPLNTVIEGLSNDELADKDLFKVKVKKEEGAKVIKEVSVVEKKFDTVPRASYIQVKTKELFDDSDNKVELEISISPKTNTATELGITLKDEYTFSEKFFVGNPTDETDSRDLKAGQGQVMIKPLKNEENEILWEDENREIARLSFEADSSVNKFYPKLSTKWDSSYNELIGNADAFIVEFVNHPVAISSTSRATLEIYNPFYNEDEDTFDVAVEDIVIYEEIDGELVDVTDKFTAGTNDDGDEVLTVRTRTLGKYIITDGTAVIDTGVEEPTEEPTETPVEGGKPNPGTGF